MRFEKCVRDTKEWTKQYILMFNDSKTEVIMFGNKIQSTKSETSGIRVGQEDIKLHTCMKYLGAHLDESFDFKIFIRNKCNTAANNLRHIGQNQKTSK